MPAAAVHGAVIGAWHLPAAFDAALDIPLLHDLEHLTFFGSALLFWHALQTAGSQARTAALGALAALLTMIYGGLLGALISFAPRPVYDRYVWTGLWGLSPLEDQQIAGLVMWVPTGMIYLAAGLLLVARAAAFPSRGRRSETVMLDLTGLPLAGNIGLFALCSAVVWAAGTRIASYVGKIGDRTGMGRAFAGLLLLGGATSLPEFANAATASVGGDAALSSSAAYP